MALGFLAHAVNEAMQSVRRERRRLYPMALGIVWGMASVMVLLAISNGFEASQKRALAAYGDRFILVRLNRAELHRAAGGKERRLRMDSHDLERLRRGAPAISRVSPMNMAYRARMTGRSGAGSNLLIAGATPEIAHLRNIPLAEGRFFDELDEAERRRVMVLGPVARKQLFGSGPAVGRTVRVGGFSTSAIAGREQRKAPVAASRRGAKVRAAPTATRPSPAQPRAASLVSNQPRTGRAGGPVLATSVAPPPVAANNATGRDVSIQSEPFRVIGVMEDVETQRESYVSVARLCFVPFSTSCAVYDKDYSTILIEPRTPEDHDLALRQFREVMGARYGFSPDDRNAVVVYFDAIERARSITAVFGGVRLFLSAVGVLILLVGAIGVMNVVLVSVAARTFEIGLRKALGATPAVIYLQFLSETVLVCLLSGGLGFLLGMAGVGLLSGLPLPQGFSQPVLDLRSVAIAFGLLAAVAVGVGLYPARRAALLQPSAALRARG